MTTLIGSTSCLSELSNISVLTASDEGQLAVVTTDGVFILVSYKIIHITCRYDMRAHHHSISFTVYSRIRASLAAFYPHMQIKQAVFERYCALGKSSLL